MVSSFYVYKTPQRQTDTVKSELDIKPQYFLSADRNMSLALSFEKCVRTECEDFRGNAIRSQMERCDWMFQLEHKNLCSSRDFRELTSYS